MTTEKTLHGIDELEAELAKMVALLGPIALASAEPAMSEALEFLRGQIPPYPSSPPPGGQLKDTTDKARRYFFWAVKQGLIPGWKWVKKTEDEPAHPEGRYRQTGHLGQSFTYDVTKDGMEVTGVIGTNTPYAPWVVGPDYPGEDFGGKTMYQARLHQNRWWQFQDVVESNIEETWRIFDEELERRITEAFEKSDAL